MKKLMILAMVLSLCSCNVMNKIAGTQYWEEVCIEPYAKYDSSSAHHKQFLITPKMYVYVTDSTGACQYAVIWGDSCGFVPGEMLYVRWHRAHSPSSGTGVWKATLINHDEHLIYTLYD